jgi:DNA-directed RNA polymerase specialized sigma24 family protein
LARAYRDASPEHRTLAREALAAALIDRAAREARPFVARLRLPPDQADDCVQVVVVKVLKHIETGRATPGKEGALVAEAARRQCLSLRRQRVVEPLDEAEGSDLETSGSSALPDDVAALWVKMPENYRQALLREQEGGPSNLERAFDTVVASHTAAQLDRMGATELEDRVKREANRLDHHLARARAWLKERMERRP